MDGVADGPPFERRLSAPIRTICGTVASLRIRFSSRTGSPFRSRIAAWIGVRGFRSRAIRIGGRVHQVGFPGVDDRRAPEEVPPFEIDQGKPSRLLPYCSPCNPPSRDYPDHGGNKENLLRA